jgi:hypothetical protein
VNFGTKVSNPLVIPYPIPGTSIFLPILAKKGRGQKEDREERRYRNRRAKRKDRENRQVF